MCDNCSKFLVRESPRIQRFFLSSVCCSRLSSSIKACCSWRRKRLKRTTSPPTATMTCSLQRWSKFWKRCVVFFPTPLRWVFGKRIFLISFSTHKNFADMACLMFRPLTCFYRFRPNPAVQRPCIFNTTFSLQWWSLNFNFSTFALAFPSTSNYKTLFHTAYLPVLIPGGRQFTVIYVLLYSLMIFW